MQGGEVALDRTDLGEVGGPLLTSLSRIHKRARREDPYGYGSLIRHQRDGLHQDQQNRRSGFAWTTRAGPGEMSISRV